jgi:hypothetical protein
MFMLIALVIGLVIALAVVSGLYRWSNNKAGRIVFSLVVWVVFGFAIYLHLKSTGLLGADQWAKQLASGGVGKPKGFDINLSWGKIIFSSLALIAIIVNGVVTARKKLWPSTRMKAQGMLSYFGFTLIALYMLAVGPSSFTSLFWLVMLLISSWLIGCAFIVPIRHRWILTFFEKPVYRIPVLLGSRRDKIKDQVRKVLIDADKLGEDDDIDLDEGTGFLDNGLAVILTPIWVLGINIIDLDYVRNEGRWETPQLPTNDPDNPLAGGTVGFDFKIWFKTNFWPQSFLRMSDADRAELPDVVRRIVESMLAEITSVLSLNEAIIAYKFFSDHDDFDDDDFDFEEFKEEIRVLERKISRERYEPTARENLRLMRYRVLTHLDIEHSEMQELRFRILKHTGCFLVGFEMLDRNPAPEIEAEMNRLTQLRTQIEEAERQFALRDAQGRAEGQAFVAKIKQIKEDLDLGDMSHVEVMEYIRQLTVAENASHVIMGQAIENFLGRRPAA